MTIKEEEWNQDAKHFLGLQGFSKWTRKSKGDGLFLYHIYIYSIGYSSVHFPFIILTQKKKVNNI